jgi:hypothetical protein
MITFEIWRRAVDVYLDILGSPPLLLADMPAGLDRALVTWHGYGVRAYVVARVFAEMMS